MSKVFDTIVLGAGPAGVAAASKACALGLDVVVVDEAESAGGQVYRAPSQSFSDAPTDSEARRGNDLRHDLAQSGATTALGHRTWMASKAFSVSAVGEEGPQILQASSLIVATGALERNIPVEGWTLPGVIGLAAATILLKSHHVLPGRRVVVAGSGPLLLLVAVKILKAGGSVAAIVDAATRSAWLSRSPSFLRRPNLAGRGAGWVATLLAHRVPIHSGHRIVRIDGSDGVETVSIAPVDAQWRVRPDVVPTEIEADSVCLGYGLAPSTEITRLLGAEHVFDPDLGGWMVAIGEDMKTTVPGLFAAGDMTGVRGADAAPISGALAAIGAAAFLGRASMDLVGERRSLKRRWKSVGAFGSAMTSLSTPPSNVAASIAQDVVVCRCEGLTRGGIEAAVRAGASTLDGLKSATRCGMGPCGGRVCGEAASVILCDATGASRRDVGQFSGRPPLRPVNLAEIAGPFNYDDLPIPQPAPL